MAGQKSSKKEKEKEERELGSEEAGRIDETFAGETLAEKARPV
jgi:hypothetical protein